MPRNPSYPGPYVIEIPYSVILTGLNVNHIHTINCKPVGTPVPGTAPTSILLSTAGGGTKTLVDAVAQYWSFLRQIFAVTATVSQANFYSVEDESYEKTFVASVTLLPALGTGGSATAAREETLTFRSALGSYMQINVIEVNAATDASIPLIPLVGGNANQKMAAYILSTDNIATCRDRTFPIGAMKASNTQNEATYRKRFRST